MVEVLKVRYKNGEGWNTLSFSEKQIFTTVGMARGYYRNKLETDKVILWYAEKI